MKKCLCLSAILLWFQTGIACAPDQSSENSLFASEVPPIGNCKTYHNDTSGIYHRICYDSVLTLINNYIEAFTEDAKNNGIGGYIDSSSLVPPHHGHTGYQGWKFFDGLYSASFKDELFLAFTYDSVSSMDSISCIISTDAYYYHSSSPMVYPDSAISTQGVSGFLSHMIKPQEPMNSYIKGGQLNNSCSKFSDHFQMGGSPTNVDYCGFFLGAEIEQLISQPGCAGVRYFYGYDGDRKNDKIRIILIGVNESGENILVDPNDTSKEALFLENAWPPAD